MISVKDLVNFVRNKIFNIYFNKIILYKKKEIVDDSFFEKRIFININSPDYIVNGRLTISIPDDIIKKVSEIMLISE